MKKLPFLLLLLLFFRANSQYYYKDLVAAADITRLMKTYTDNNIKKVTARGITPEGGPASDFSEVGEINANGTSLKVTTNNNKVISTLRYNFNDRGLLISSIDSTVNVKSTSTYTYDANGKITSISNSATDADSSGDFSQSEVHQYIYKDGKLDKMWRIINKSDSLEVRFVTDEKGNVIEERNFRRGVLADPTIITMTEIVLRILSVSIIKQTGFCLIIFLNMTIMTGWSKRLQPLQVKILATLHGDTFLTKKV